MCVLLVGVLLVGGYLQNVQSANIGVLSRKLSSGYDMPLIGLGTWQITEDEMGTAISTALENGYRYFDGAWAYFNEQYIGNSLKKWFDKGNKREEVFLGSKLPPFSNSTAAVEILLKQTLANLQVDYLDMYLVHLPTRMKVDESFTPLNGPDGNPIFDENYDLLEVWKAMEEQVRVGRTKSIGLSNVNESQVLRIYEQAEIKPAAVQVELHAYHQNPEMLALCKKLSIAVIAYAPLTSPKNTFSQTRSFKALPSIYTNRLVNKLAEKYNKTKADILLRQNLQNGVHVIPKSVHPDRIISNMDVFNFALEKEDLKKLNNLDRGEIGRGFNFLMFKGYEKQPEYPFRDHLKIALPEMREDSSVSEYSDISGCSGCSDTVEEY